MWEVIIICFTCGFTPYYYDRVVVKDTRIAECAAVKRETIDWLRDYFPATKKLGGFRVECSHIDNQLAPSAIRSQSPKD